MFCIWHINWKIHFRRWNALAANSEAVAQKCSVKKVFLEISQNSQENNRGQSIFFNKVAGPACNFIKKDALTQVFSCEFWEISKNTVSYRTLLVAASASAMFCHPYGTTTFADIFLRKFMCYNVTIPVFLSVCFVIKVWLKYFNIFFKRKFFFYSFVQHKHFVWTA